MNTYATGMQVARNQRTIRCSMACAVLCCGVTLLTPAMASTCYGNADSGRIDGAVPLPASGPNFAPYATLGIQLGRTYVHETVRDIVSAAYKDLETLQPRVTYVYGESGLRQGGPMPPHRTHEAGVSVDFMVPVRASDGSPARLPASAANRFGYDLEFDSKGTLGALRIDYEALAAHLDRLQQQAKQHNVAIRRVIFDHGLTRHLFDTAAGPRLKSLPFMASRPWVRHDEHYHVDFAIRCAKR